MLIVSRHLCFQWLWRNLTSLDFFFFLAFSNLRCMENVQKYFGSQVRGVKECPAEILVRNYVVRD